MYQVTLQHTFQGQDADMFHSKCALWKETTDISSSFLLTAVTTALENAGIPSS